VRDRCLQRAAANLTQHPRAGANIPGTLSHIAVGGRSAGTLSMPMTSNAPDRTRASTISKAIGASSGRARNTCRTWHPGRRALLWVEDLVNVDQCGDPAGLLRWPSCPVIETADAESGRAAASNSQTMPLHEISEVGRNHTYRRPDVSKRHLTLPSSSR
jgi:hypothetical protein